MGGLFNGQSTSTTAERLAGIELQTSAYGGVLALAYGTTRVPANLIWHDDFKAIPHTTTQRVGKGGGSSTSNTTYTYTASVMLAVCEGPVSINRVWKDKESGAMSGYGLTLLSGTRPQTPWTYLTSKHPIKAIGYAGTAIVAHSAMDLGSSAVLQNHSFEVVGFHTIGAGNPDAHPADIVTHFLTDPYAGADPSFPLGDLTSGTGSFRNYCTACGFWLSPAFTEQRAAREHLKQILEATNSEAVWSTNGTGMALKIIPYGDTAVTGNGTTYTPNTTPIYDLGPDDFLVSTPGDDPIKIERKSPAEAWNCVPVEFRDRLLDYNTNVVDDPDPVQVETFGLRKSQPLSLHCITRQTVALQVSRIKAQRSSLVRNVYKFRLGWRFARLEPMDLATLTEPIIGFDHKVVRIKSVEEDREGALTITAEEWPFGVATPTLYTTQGGDGTVPDVNADPGNANSPVIFSVPALITKTAAPEVIIATSGGELWGGCEVWVSSDNATYAYAGSISTPARHGVLYAAMSTSPDTSDVDLAQSRGELQSVDAQTATDGLSLCWCDGEMFSYQTAGLTGTNRYSLSTLQRGLHGTSEAVHPSGSKFLRVDDDAVLRYQVPPSRIGQLLYVKLVSVNVWGGGKQDISTLTPYTFTPSVQALPAPSGVTITVSDTKP